MISNGRFLGASVSTGYRPQVLGFSPNRLDHRGLFMPGEVDAMRRDPQVQFGLRILYAPLPSVQWQIEGDREVVQLVDQTLKRLWVNHLGQLFAAVVYGHAAAEVLYRQDDSGKVTFDRLRDFHPMDCKPLARDGELAGISVRGIAGENGRGWILPPRSLWLASEAEFGNLYGQSRLRQAWYPWQELTARHGALDVRRHWFVKNAFRGARMRHPSGTIEVEAGVYRTCQDYAREMVEKFETGGVLTLPNTYDPETGKYEWEWEDPTPLGDPPGLNEYIDALDVRILVALGIPPEVARAAETGSGWSGRSIPFIVYLTSEDLIASTLLKGVDEQICRNLVTHQFSAQAARSYQVLPVSLVPPEARDDATQGAAGVPGGQVGQPGQPEQAQGAVGLDSLLNESLGWEAYQGKRGGRGWKNTQTGEVLYQDEKPGERSSGKSEVPGNARQLAKKVQDLTPQQRAELKKRLEARGEPASQEKAKKLAEQALAQTQESQPATVQPSPGSDPAAFRPSRPEERRNIKPPALPDKRKPPPPRASSKAPRNAEGRPVTGYAANGIANTYFGDLVENATEKLQLRSILPEGKRSHAAGEVEELGSSLDREYDHSGYAMELKAVCVEGTEYKSKLKKSEAEDKRRFAEMHQLTPATMIVVVDTDQGEAHAYWREGIGAFAVNPDHLDDWNYAGTVSLDPEVVAQARAKTAENQARAAAKAKKE